MISFAIVFIPNFTEFWCFFSFSFDSILSFFSNIFHSVSLVFKKSYRVCFLLSFSSTFRVGTNWSSIDDSIWSNATYFNLILISFFRVLIVFNAQYRWLHFLIVNTLGLDIDTTEFLWPSFVDFSLSANPIGMKGWGGGSSIKDDALGQIKESPSTMKRPADKNGNAAPITRTSASASLFLLFLFLLSST